MALDLGDLVGRLKLEDEFSDTFSKAEKSGGGFGKVFKNVAVGVGVAMAAIGAATAVGVGALVKAGLSYNRQMETYETNLGTLLGSTERAKDLMVDLTSFSASTPFEMPTLADAAQTLLNFGSSVEDLLPDLQMLGDISLGNSQKLGGLSLVFGQVQANGRLMGQDVLQMINNGFNPLLEITKMTGESMVEVKKRMEQGGVGFDEVRAAMQNATAEGGQFFEAMKAGSQTLDGQMSTMTDLVNIFAGSITGSLAASLTSDGLPAVNTFLNSMIDLMNGVDGAEDAVKDAAGGIAAALRDGVGPAISEVVSNIGFAVGAIAPVLGEIAIALVQALAEVIPALVVVAGEIVLSLVTAIVEAAPMMVSAAIPAVVSLVEGLVAALPMVLTAAVEIIVALAQGLSDAIPVLIPAAIAAILGLAEGLLSALPVLLTTALELIMALAMGLLDAIPALIAEMPAIILALVDFFVDSIPQIIRAGIDLLVALVEALPVIVVAIVSAIPVIINGLLDALTGSIPELIDAGVTLLISLIENLPLIISTLVMAVPEIVMGLFGALTSPRTLGKMGEAGMAIITGLWEGLKRMWGSIVSWFTDMAGGLIDSFKGLFGINSPSTVFRGFGINIGEGLIEGLSDIEPEVDANFNSMLDVPSTSDPTRGTMAGAKVSNHREVHVHMESSRSTLDEEAIFEALSGARGV